MLFTERAEPRAINWLESASLSFPSVLNKIVGRPVSWAICPATRPKTPADHWESSKTIILVVDKSNCASFLVTCAWTSFCKDLRRELANSVSSASF